MSKLKDGLVNKLLKLDANAELNELLKLCEEEPLFFGEEKRLLSSIEINDKDEFNLEPNIIPLIDLYDNNFLAYDLYKNHFVELNISDDVIYKIVDSIQEYIDEIKKFKEKRLIELEKIKLEKLASINLITAELANDSQEMNSDKVDLVKVYLNKFGEVIILGIVEKSCKYCWCSITKLDEEELNGQIFEYITTNRFIASANLGDIYKTLEQKGITKDKLKYYYTIYKRDFRNGATYARNLPYTFGSVRNMCQARLADGEYFKILQKYLAIIKGQSGDGLSWKINLSSIDFILSNESYLRIADGEAASLYVQCCDELYSKYCSYMGKAK